MLGESFQGIISPKRADISMISNPKPSFSMPSSCTGSSENLHHDAAAQRQAIQTRHRRKASLQESIVLCTCDQCGTVFYRVKKYCTSCGAKLTYPNGGSSPCSSVATSVSERLHQLSVSGEDSNPPSRKDSLSQSPLRSKKSLSFSTDIPLDKQDSATKDTSLLSVTAAPLTPISDCVNVSPGVQFNIKVKVCRAQHD